ncbi:hypothetical protein CBM2634_A240128 [Cupriavidus taiwanensis]|uniref:Uncharacterized protein n=1 Tax=Cupriavidus taiwanensis TaxID=164546 RepID=A0A375J3R2_9BURK|nr:hypothetical protein CBM2634_A240128 [Cupriavidus taiwanensis]
MDRLAQNAEFIMCRGHARRPGALAQAPPQAVWDGGAGFNPAALAFGRAAQRARAAPC